MTAAKGTILLVDDEPVVLGSLSEILRDHGYRVIEASSGPEALEQLSREAAEPDVLLTDLIMPGMTGRVLADSLLARFPRIIVVFMSGHIDDSRAFNGDPAVNYIQKPYDPAKLVELLRQLIRKRGRKG